MEKGKETKPPKVEDLDREDKTFWTTVEAPQLEIKETISIKVVVPEPKTEDTWIKVATPEPRQEHIQTEVKEPKSELEYTSRSTTPEFVQKSVPLYMSGTATGESISGAHRYAFAPQGQSSEGERYGSLSSGPAPRATAIFGGVINPSGGGGGGGLGGGPPGPDPDPELQEAPGNAPQGQGKGKIKDPEVFNEDRDKTRSFLNQLFLLFTAQPHDFVTDYTKVATALSFMEGDNINYWKDITIQRAKEEIRPGVYRGFDSWQVFKRNFLLLKDYSSVDEFNARFMDLALKGKILDPAAQLALYHLTEKILANCRGRKAKTSKTRKNVKTVNVEDNSININKLSVKERQELQDKGLCFWCRKPGHISRDCPSKPKKPSKPVSWKGYGFRDGFLGRQADSMPDLPKELHVQDKAVEIKGLINTGADAVIVNEKIVDKYNLPTVRLPKTLTFRNTDDSVNSMGTITHRVEGTFNLHGKKLPTNWYVADIGRDNVLFGMPWIHKYNPNIDWESGHITFKSDIIKQQQIHKYQCEHDPPEGMLWNFPVKPLNQNLVVSFVRAIPDKDDADPDSEQLTFNPSRAIELWYRKKKIRKIDKFTEITIAAKKDQKEKTLDEILPDFVQDYRQVFEKKAASRFPPLRPWDHAIEFKKDFDHHNKGSWRKIYPLTYTERIELDKFIAENLEKGYI
ncbi:hypothetical protein ONZ51_g12256 [Trametes cubensis]|uniref:CCHC-type domain-containing protein n=1 Tax=Trametes cubensis TaxID=1111947 RepID=A0AAD7X4R8_9APHY|nr:hypothetical protein ONZ51_g12256 [Trametes cubensis]